MGLFSNTSPFDVEVEKATNEKNTTEDWGQIMEICDAVGNSPQKAKECLKAIVKRLNAVDPHIVIQAITLLDACSSNCGKTFHLEIASRDFESEIKKILLRSQPKIVEKMKILLKKWAEGDFKNDPQLNLIPTLYNKLKNEGHDFSLISEMPKHSGGTASSAASKEDQDLAKAIELSLKENKQHSSSSHGSPASSKMTSLYPSVNLSLSNSSPPERRKVRALYDFEAAEDNELSFIAGDIIHILDDSDANWWKGAKGKMEGLFPSNFVTADLSVEPDHITKLEQGTKKAVQFAEEVEVKMLKREPEIIEVDIDETKIDRLLHLLHEADPQSDTTDPPEMLDLEEQVTAMGPLIDTALEKVDRQHAQLTQLSSDLVDALNLYHTLMREPTITTPYSTLSKMPPHMNVYPYPNQPPQMYNGMMQQPRTSYNPVAGLPPGTYHQNMPGMPTEYMNHSMAGMSLPQQYHMPPASHQHPPPSAGHHPPGPTGPPVGVPPHSVVTQNHPPGHQPAGGRPLQSQAPQLVHQQAPPTQTLPAGHQGHPQTHTQGPTSAQAPDRTSLPYQSQGYVPQVTQIPVQYIPPELQGGHPPNQQPQYAPPSGQRMM
ncbi:signal transducing adapter molecule 1 [Microplitis demolitor]|uniref:signal transducing adapter molecule 1 n=1 Tax=Microplitis demolitor TaxID=69319 RepID=UPI0006D51C1E|nr:signal transducing adapter molecule 1 [Microplitis demolitor]